MSEQDYGQGDDWRNKDVFDPKKHRERLDYACGAALFAVLTAIGLGVFYLADKSLIGGYWTNIVSTVLGAVLTIVILDKRNDYRAEREFKERLILQMGSTDNGFAGEAVRLLARKGWLIDGCLQRANLSHANLQKASLRDADLQKAYLEGANLQEASLAGADLQEAKLWEANLQGAGLHHANLQKADLWSANLQRSFLVFANLQKASLEDANLQKAYLDGADLRGASLEDADLEKSIFDKSTILPDGSRWTPGRNMREFTDPNYPHFWRSDDPDSPAYRDD